MIEGKRVTIEGRRATIEGRSRQLREDRGMRDDARQAGIVEGRGGPSERPVLAISGSGEGRRKQGGTLDPDIPKEERKNKSSGQLSTVHTRTRAGENKIKNRGD